VHRDPRRVVNGSKTFITNGFLCDLVIVVAKTNPEEQASGVSLILVETTRQGFSRGRNLEKIGQHGQDTCELFFDDVRVPAANLLGEEGKGFIYLMEQLPQERLTIAVPSVAVIEAAVELTIKYTKEREAFGRHRVLASTQTKPARVSHSPCLDRSRVKRRACRRQRPLAVGRH
jgi:acyl-CoA dehydrogenase